MTLQLSIITPEKILYSADAEMVTVPGTEGDFGVLDGHAPFISTIRPGVITIDISASEKRKIAVVGGVAEVTPEHCAVLAEVAEDCTNLTQTEAQARVDSAKKALETASTADAREAEKRLALAEAILQAA